MAKKSLQIMIQVDDVEFKDVEIISDTLDELFDKYEFKRIELSMRDSPSVRPPIRV